MNSNKSAKPTQEYSSESLSRMVLSWRESKKSTRDPELDYICKQRDSADTAVPVREKVPERQECPLKSSGLEDKEFSEDFSENTEPQKRSIELFIINSISPQRVISLRTKPSWLKQSSSKKLKKLMPKSSKLNKKPEDLRIKTEEKEEPKRLKNFDLPKFKYFILLLYLKTYHLSNKRRLNSSHLH